MNTVYFTIISAFLFALFAWTVVGIATEMAMTPFESGDSDDLRLSPTAYSSGHYVCFSGG